MQIAADAVRFLHLADLHLMPCPRHGACGPNDPACHACIKARVLAGLAQRIANPATRPGVILLAGDLTELRERSFALRAAAAPLDRFVRAARAFGIVVAGITGDHDGEDGTTRLRDELGWDWLLRSGEVNRAAKVAVHAVEGRPRRAGAAEELAALRRNLDEPSIALLHGDEKLVRTDHGPAFDYYAMGHLHRARIRLIGKGAHGFVGYPGHLFSYWDGDGKSWPVYVIEGTIARDGTVNAELVSLAREVGAPETRRMYVEFANAGRPDGAIVFENAPPAAVFQELQIDAQIEDQVADGGSYRRIAQIPYGSRTELQDLLARVLRRLPDDVFVSPSTGGGWHDRLADHGRAIVSRRFPEFVQKTFKRSAETQ